LALRDGLKCKDDSAESRRANPARCLPCAYPSPERTAPIEKCLKFWSGRRDSNPRPRPRDGRGQDAGYRARRPIRTQAQAHGHQRKEAISQLARYWRILPAPIVSVTARSAVFTRAMNPNAWLIGEGGSENNRCASKRPNGPHLCVSDCCGLLVPQLPGPAISCNCAISRRLAAARSASTNWHNN
jgi:hypothetical protein